MINKKRTKKKRPLKATVGKGKLKSSGARKSAVTPMARDTLARLTALEGIVDQLRGQLVHAGSERDADIRSYADLLNQVRFVRSTADGWLTVLIDSTRTSLPSGLKVSLTGNSGGRDFGKVLEGVQINKNFDVTAGNLDAAFRRVTDLKVSAAKRAGGPVQRDGDTYDLDLKLSYKEDGAVKSAGPFLAKMDPSNPLPSGTHDLEIPDFPHRQGTNSVPHGTVWFRIGHSGDRYMHPGSVSLGCMTCAPSHWEQIYAIVHCGRLDDTNVGKLTYTP
jgi:hypothetical protein